MTQSATCDEGFVARSADPRVEHPNPLLRRTWWSLDGPWDFSYDDTSRPTAAIFPHRIIVPFSPTTTASGAPESDHGCSRVWYRRRVSVPPAGGGRILLHFGAIDRVATVWVNGEWVGSHTGGYTPFWFDITDALIEGAEAEVIVRADDPPHDLSVPRGKQDWRDAPHAVFYPRTTGIWRTVWIERVGTTFIESIEWHGNPDTMEISASVILGGLRTGDERVRVLLTSKERVIGQVEVGANIGSVGVRIPIGDGGIDDRWELTWWPARPVLIDASVTVVAGNGELVDQAQSYTALRRIDVAGGQVLVNGRPTFLRMVLDQGYWPATGATPPDVEALRVDVDMCRRLGFNAVRKHQKTEDPRFYALADEAGLLVWVEMPSAYRSGSASASALFREWAEIVHAHRNFPSVMAWVPLNESWGVASIATDGRQRATAEGLAAMARSLDGTRPVSVNDGWETTGGSLVGIHDYGQDAGELRDRYSDPVRLEAMVRGTGPSGYRIDLDGEAAGDRAVVLSEFGGVALSSSEGNWGYAQAGSADDLLQRYRELWEAVRASPILAGACWTQLTDTYQEANGLLNGEREPKADLNRLSAATRGRPDPDEVV